MASVEMLWELPPAKILLAVGEVHLWCVNLDQPAGIEALFKLLTQEEQQRANQFRLGHIRRYHIVGRATLRRLLAEQLEVGPTAFDFHYGARGKPELAPPFAGNLHFNISHSGALGLIAITRIGPVGVDVEHVRALDTDVEIARRFFTARESSGLEALPENKRPAAFFNLWTRKEAWIKATGSGIAESLNRVEAAFLPGEPARLLSIGGQEEEAAQWTLVELEPARGFSGTLAIRARGFNVRCWQFPD